MLNVKMVHICICAYMHIHTYRLPQRKLKVDKGMMVHSNPSWQLLHKNKPSRRLFSNIDLIVCLLTGTYIIGFNGQSKVGRLSVSILSSTQHLAYLIKMLQSDAYEELMTESSAVQYRNFRRGKSTLN